MRRILRDAHVDTSGVRFDQKTVTARDAWNGGPWETYNEVRVTGSRDARRDVDAALMAAGLSCAPYPDYSLWSR